MLQEALHYSAFVLIIEGMATNKIICFWTTGPVVLLGTGLGSALKLLKPVSPAVLSLVSSTVVYVVVRKILAPQLDRGAIFLAHVMLSFVVCSCICTT